MGSDIDGESSYDYSGWSVSLSPDGSTVAIGAPYNDGAGTNSGHVRIYSLDTDGDGFPNTIDAFPLDFSESVDTDSDGTGNNADTDDDGDGVIDTDDAFPLDSSESVDTDGDGTGNNADTDDDGDGVLDTADAFPLDSTESADTDSDGTGNNADTDDDGDGVLDTEDAFPLDASESVDTDGDGTGNNADTDDDGDGVLDTADAFPLDSSESVDTDGDGTGNNADTDDDGDEVLDTADAFPLDSSESVDTDGDGTGNNADTDDDGDGVLDTADAFPLDSTEIADTDSDGTGNNADTDDDGDGVLDTDDAFPLDSSESVDTDGDGTGNNADTDDDGDGVADTADSFPLDSSETIDTDGDGTGNNADTDDDNDGVLDTADAFPLDFSESVDTDNDGTGNNADPDDDGDGVADTADAFPLDSTESVDTDSDGTGNNADMDDDGDGVLDTADAFPLDSSETIDTDNDGVGDNSDDDANGDGVLDSSDWYLGNSSPLLGTDGSIQNPQGRDAYFKILSWGLPSSVRPGETIETKILLEYTDEVHPGGAYDREDPVFVSVFGNWSKNSSIADLRSGAPAGDPREENYSFDFVAPSEEGEYVLRLVSSNGSRISSSYYGEGDSSILGAYAEISFAVVALGGAPATPEGLSATSGAETVSLRWDPIADVGLSGYDVYRGLSSDSGSMEKVNSGGPVYGNDFVDSTVSRYQTYYYRLRAVGEDGQVSGFSKSASATVSRIVMRIDDYAGSPGSEVSMTISAENAVGVSGNGLDIRVTYDQSILEPVSVENTYLTEGFIVAHNASTATGQLNISAISSSGSIQALGGLFDIVFRVSESASLGSTGSHVLVDARLFDENLDSLSVDYSDTAEFVVSNKYRLGDISGDGEVFSQDALLAMRHALGVRIITEDTKAFMAGDINKDGLIDAADVSLILEMSVSGSSETPRNDIWAQVLSEGQSSAYHIDSGDATPLGSGRIMVPVSVGGPSGIRGVELQIGYDPSVLDLSDVSATGGFSTYLVGSGGVRGSERVLLAKIPETTVSSSGGIELVFDLTGSLGSASPVRLIDYKITGENSEDVSYFSEVVATESEVSAPLADADADGVGDESDAFPYDPEESFDTDSDGVGDVADADADGDGFTDDLEESAGGDPTDPTDSSKTTTYLAQKGLSQSVLSSARELGRADVESSPSSYGIDLYTASELESAAAAARTIVNVSSRVTLGTGEMVTPGFVVLGTSKKLLIRAVGPKLGDLGVSNPLPNPRMTIYRTRYDGNPPDVVATIDDWKVDNPISELSSIVSAMESAGAFPLEPTETFQGRPFMTDDTTSAATLVTLDIGVYTVQVDSADDGVGDVLVEVYEITDSSNGGTGSSNLDSDGDGYTDDLETLAGGDPSNGSDATVTDQYLATLSIDSSVFDSARTLGRQDVQVDPTNYDLYTASELESAAAAARTIVNVSSRVTLGTGEMVTPGFVVLGTSKKLLIRAVGPKLGDLGVGSPLPNPRMTVYRTRYDGNPPDVVATIDDWKIDNPESEIQVIRSAMESAGAFPLEPTETFQGRPFMTDDTSSAATLVTLDIGVYTVQVDSADDGVGDVLVEVYEITD